MLFTGTWPGDYHTKWNKSDREGEILYNIPYMWNIKRNHMKGLMVNGGWGGRKG